MTAPTRPDELRFAIELIDACRKVVGDIGVTLDHVQLEVAAQLRELRLGLDAVRATLANLPGATHERECTCDYCIDSARQLAAALAGKGDA